MSNDRNMVANPAAAGQVAADPPSTQPGGGPAQKKYILDFNFIPHEILQFALSIMVGALSLLDIFDDMVKFAYVGNTNTRYSFDDIGASNLMADVFRSQLRYVVERNAWYCYDGRVWKKDTNMVAEQCKFLFKMLGVLAQGLPNGNNYDSVNKLILATVKKWKSRRGRETILKDAETVYPIKVKDFDKDPFLLNCLTAGCSPGGGARVG